MAVGGGDGHASVKVTPKEDTTLVQMAAHTASNPGADPMTGAELGMGAKPVPNGRSNGKSTGKSA